MIVDWKGVYPALTTKFTEDDRLDIPAFLKNLDFQINAGIHGVVLGGSLGEASTLTNAEKLELLKVTVFHIKGRIPIIINIAEQSTRAAIKRAQEAQNNEANGLMILPPLKYAADSRETVTYFEVIAKNTDLPIMVYNNPNDYKVLITLSMFADLAAQENIVAVKESTRDITNVTRMRNAFGDRFKILCGVDTLALEELLLGADGWVAGLVDAFPREAVVIYELVQQARLKEAREIYRWFMPLLELDIHPKLVQYIKLAEVATGLGTENVRAPRLPLVGEERARIQKVIDDALAVRPQMPRL